MALNLQTLTSPTTSSDVIADIENPADSSDLVVTLKNLATGNGATTNATQTVSAAQGTAVQGDTSYLVMDLVDDEYEFTTDSAVNGTIVVATLEGTYSANISLDASTQYDLQARGVASSANVGFLKNPVGYLVSSSPLSESEVTQMENYFVDKGAAARSAFGSVTNFNSAWKDCSSITSFPAINAPSVTDFYRAWRQCSSLTSFPLINPESALRFRETWYGCTSLTTFPANFFDDWSPSSLYTKTFDNAWYNCTSLTAQSVENILASIDTSGVYGTNTGASGGTQLSDITIDIDYDGTTLSSATSTAITSLKSKNWAISINSVIQ